MNFVDRISASILAILSAASFATMAFLVHIGRHKYPPHELNLARAAINLTILFPFVWRSIPSILTKEAFPIWSRSIAGALSVLCYYWTLQNTSTGNAISITNLSPVFVVLFSRFFFREAIQTKDKIGIVLAISGSLSLSALSGETNPPSKTAIAVGLASAVCSSLAFISLRRAAMKFSPLLIVFCFSFASAISSSLLAVDSWVKPIPGDGIYLLGIGLSGLAGQIFMTSAYINLSAPVASALGLSTLIWAVAISAIFEHQLPAAASFACYIVILVGIFIIQNNPNPAGQKK